NKILVDGRIFITPKFFDPNMSWYNSSCMCDGIINVFRVHVCILRFFL
ncbi:hypothetical protein ALC53_08788, partial [Atta colombica]